MTNSHSYELIASVIHTDLSAPVMEAARKAGCQGGTLIKAREIGSDADGGGSLKSQRDGPQAVPLVSVGRSCRQSLMS